MIVYTVSCHPIHLLHVWVFFNTGLVQIPGFWQWVLVRTQWIFMTCHWAPPLTGSATAGTFRASSSRWTSLQTVGTCRYSTSAVSSSQFSNILLVCVCVCVCHSRSRASQLLPFVTQSPILQAFSPLLYKFFNHLLPSQ